MKRFIAVVLMLALVCACVPAFAEEEMAPMYTLTEQYGFKLGAPLSFDQLRNQKYLKLVKAHFNSITTTNEMKAYSLLDQKATLARTDGMPAMNYWAADQMVQWAQDNGIGVRGHVLVWDAYMTDWYFHEDYDSKKELYALIQKMCAEFEERQGTIICRELLGLKKGEDLGEPSVRTEEYYKSRPCIGACRTAAGIAEKYLL